MKVHAFAKINLGLKIVGKQKSGFHEIETIFAKIELFDELEFRLRKDSKIFVRTENAKIPTEQNLVFRAACLLQKLAAKSAGVEIFLRKRIPLGGGLGGGSSDAATTLQALNKIWQLKLRKKELQKIGADLGSDIPFFFEKKVCQGRGRGELLQEISLPKKFPREILLIVPKITISTTWAYSHVQTFKKARSKFENDFENIIFRKFPDLKKIKTQLEKSGAKLAILSGSGSVIFGLFKNKPNRDLIQQFEKFGQVFVSKIRD